MQFDELYSQHQHEPIDNNHDGHDTDEDNGTADFQDCHEYTDQINQINQNYTLYFDDNNCYDDDEYFQSNPTTRMFKKCVSIWPFGLISRDVAICA